ncbi:MAG: hypothetical protein IJY86_08510 [Clostridia bacterium]|nr:hypothetical protein [Clostridia bacterium]
MKKTLRNTAAVAASVLLISISLLCLTSCTSVPDPRETVEDAIAAVKAYDTEKMEAHWGREFANLDSTDSIAKKICSGLSYKIVSHSIDGERATVTVDITNTDMAELSARLIEELESEGASYADNSNRRLAQLLCRPGNSRVGSTVEINLRLTDEGWVLTDNNSAAVYAMLGGMCSLEALCPGVVMVPVAVELSGYILN